MVVIGGGGWWPLVMGVIDAPIPIWQHGITVTIPVPAKTKSKDVRVSMQEGSVSVIVVGHPLNQIMSGELFAEIDTTCSEWHLEGDFEDRKLVRRGATSAVLRWIAWGARGRQRECEWGGHLRVAHACHITQTWHASARRGSSLRHTGVTHTLHTRYTHVTGAGNRGRVRARRQPHGARSRRLRLVRLLLRPRLRPV